MEQIGRILTSCGAALWGICAFPPERELLPCRAASRLPEHPCRVVMCAFPYRTEDSPGRNISRYAVVADYHRVVRSALEQVADKLSARLGGTFVPFVDSSPIPEVACAVRAGLGVRGKNGLLITRECGSFVFLGELVTDLPLPCSPPDTGSCLSCGRCQAACPGQAIGEQGVDASRCLSHITQKKGALTGEEQELIRRGGLLWGCDRCQEVCPHNRTAKKTLIPAFLEDRVARLRYDAIRPLCKTRAFGFRGPKVLERNWDILYGRTKEKKNGSL